jgi:hypothetical protein
MLDERGPQLFGRLCRASGRHHCQAPLASSVCERMFTAYRERAFTSTGGS